MSNSSTPSSTPNDPIKDLPSSEKPPVFVKETTGSVWTDVWIAFKRIGRQDFEKENLERVPCLRSSLMSGIATGAGVGVIRGLSAGPRVAVNWALGSFMLVSIGTWKVCQNSMEEERKKVQRIIEAMPKRTLKKKEDGVTYPTGGVQ